MRPGLYRRLDACQKIAYLHGRVPAKNDVETERLLLKHDNMKRRMCWPSWYFGIHLSLIPKQLLPEYCLSSSLNPYRGRFRHAIQIFGDNNEESN